MTLLNIYTQEKEYNIDSKDLNNFIKTHYKQWIYINFESKYNFYYVDDFANNFIINSQCKPSKNIIPNMCEALKKINEKLKDITFEYNKYESLKKNLSYTQFGYFNLAKVPEILNIFNEVGEKYEIEIFNFDYLYKLSDKDFNIMLEDEIKNILKITNRYCLSVLMKEFLLKYDFKNFRIYDLLIDHFLNIYPEKCYINFTPERVNMLLNYHQIFDLYKKISYEPYFITDVKYENNLFKIQVNYNGEYFECDLDKLKSIRKYIKPFIREKIYCLSYITGNHKFNSDDMRFSLYKIFEYEDEIDFDMINYIIDNRNKEIKIDGYNTKDLTDKIKDALSDYFEEKNTEENF